MLELAGMAPRSEISGVTILRPLFGLTKAPVLDLAHRFAVPYFKDTTPLWSTRGKLRTRLLPLLQEVYGEGVRAILLTRRRAFVPAIRETPMRECVGCGCGCMRAPF